MNNKFNKSTFFNNIFNKIFNNIFNTLNPYPNFLGF